MAKDESEKPSADFLSTLGMVDIVLGGLVVYLSFLSLKQTGWHSPFVTTQNAYVDLILAICAASLAGKLLSLAIAFLMAAWSGAAGRIADLSGAINRLAPRTTPPKNASLLDISMALVSMLQPSLAADAARARTESLFANGAAVLAVGYSLFLNSAGHRRLSIGVGASAVLFLFLGLLKQFEYALTLRNALWISSATRELAAGDSEETQMWISFKVATVQQVSLGDATQFLAALTALRNSLAFADGSWKPDLRQETRDQLKKIGQAITLGSDALPPRSPGHLYELATLSGVSTAKFIVLKEGSLEGTLVEVGAAIRRRLERILRASAALTSDSLGEASFSAAIRQEFGGAQLDEVAAGIAALAGRELKESFAHTGARGLDVFVSDAAGV